ncbi:putative cell division protein kinase 10 protein [Lasiodiplodia theobromae]|nr:putative cell division protein kinase 10 protein [Lasiodiplodia theobromae]
MDDTPECADHVSVTGHKIDLSLDHGFLGNCSSISSYESLDAIGEGAYGIVSRARDRRSGSVVALKQIRILEYERNNGIPLTALREISILRSLRHQNVINVLEVAVDDAVLEDVYMVMEYCEKVGSPC